MLCCTRESHYPISQTDQSTGPVNRQIRVIVRTVGEHRVDMNGVDSYSGAISLVNLNRTCRRFGIPVPKAYWTRLWLVRDCAGYGGAGFTWFLIFGGEVLVFIALLTLNFSFFVLLQGFLSLSCAALGTIAHLRAMFTNPGAVPRGDATKENIARMGLQDGAVVYRCPKCDCIKPERAHHCSICRRCIRKMDHHCPWINNCVGEFNQKFFVLFTMYIAIISWHGLFLGIYTLVSCAMKSFQGCGGFSPTTQIVVLSLLMLEGLMFGLFTTIMCGSQLSAIGYDETGIEQLKKENGKWKKRTCWMNMQEVFGGKFSYIWFSPFHINLSSDDEDDDVGDSTCVYSTL